MKATLWTLDSASVLRIYGILLYPIEIACKAVLSTTLQGVQFPTVVPTTPVDVAIIHRLSS
jgi:hypothetical protein